MRARIYRPARNAMQSGMARTKEWILEMEPKAPPEIDPLMGWTSTRDTRSQVKLRFATKEAALEYAREHGLDAVVLKEEPRKLNIRPRGYGENFAPDRRIVWTH